MATFATLDHNNTVDNVIVAETKEIAEDVTGKTCVPCEGTQFMRHTWNGSEFIAPVIIEAQPEQPAVE